jgi:Uma2 family endonuclease
MSTVREITVPVTKPATEWVNGRALQKVSPQEEHGRAQRRVAAALGAWADETASGRVSTEWEFRITPPHEATRPLVPDVAFLSYDSLSYEQHDAAQIPYMAPDVAVEVLSPNDQRPDVDERIRVYLAAGSELVLLVDPATRTFVAHDAHGVRSLSADQTFTHGMLPGFAIRVGSVFEESEPKRTP